MPMDAKFAALVEALAPKLECLLAMRPVRLGALPRDIPCSGVYLFTENGRHLYMGRSRNLRGRYGLHCRPSATRDQASFAFQLAREQTGRTTVSYKGDQDSRAGLMQDPAFVAAFLAAKQRVRSMDYRCVEKVDRNRQALLEIYCAIILETPYNDFGTH